MSNAKFEVYMDAGGQYRWRLKDGSGEKVASSGESFYSRESAKRAARNVKVTAPAADISA